jgi:hypothetical protein
VCGSSLIKRECVWKEGDEKVEEREVRRDEDEGFSVLGSSKLDFLQWPISSMKKPLFMWALKGKPLSEEKKEPSVSMTFMSKVPIITQDDVPWGFSLETSFSEMSFLLRVL